MREATRREFVGTVAAAMGGRFSLAWSRTSQQGGGIRYEQTVQQVIDAILSAVPGPRRADTVDRVKAGDAIQLVRGIATTFLASCDVIKRAVDAGANLVITHEPTFYNHLDKVDWLQGDAVYEFKRRLISDLGVVVWRFHDYLHQVEPDPVNAALLADTRWSAANIDSADNIVEIAPASLRQLASDLKSRLALPLVRIAGDPEMRCSRVGIMPGAAGGEAQIGFLSKNDIDVLVCGEVDEWETNEYVRDAWFAGLPKGLVILGHVQSEEPGMRALVDWLKPLVPAGIPVFHVPARDSFTPI